VGQYVARIYDEVRARPLYLVRDARGLPPARHTAEAAPADGTRWQAADGESLNGSRRLPLPPA